MQQSVTNIFLVVLLTVAFRNHPLFNIYICSRSNVRISDGSISDPPSFKIEPLVSNSPCSMPKMNLFRFICLSYFGILKCDSQKRCHRFFPINLLTKTPQKVLVVVRDLFSLIYLWFSGVALRYNNSTDQVHIESSISRFAGAVMSTLPMSRIPLRCFGNGAAR